MKKTSIITFRKALFCSFFLVLFLTFVNGVRAEASDRVVEVGSSIMLTDNNMTNGSGYIKRWSSSNTSIASTSGSGTSCAVFGIRPGTATIACYTTSWVSRPFFQWTGPYASDGYWTIKTDYSYTTRYYTVKVVNGVQSVNFSSSSQEMEVGEKTKFSLIITPSDAEVTSVLYSSSDSSVAEVAGDGEVTAKKQGTAVITASVNGKYRASCTVTVRGVKDTNSGQNSNGSGNSSSDRNSVKKETKTSSSGDSSSRKLRLNTGKVTLQIGEKFQLAAKAGTKKVKPVFKSSDGKKAAVNKKGMVTAKSCGKVKITATLSGGKKVSCSVKVIPKKVETFKIIEKKNKLLLRWKKSSKIDGYKIYRSSQENDGYRLVKTVSASRKRLLLKKPKTGTYFYKIGAFKKVGGKSYNGALSTPVSVTIY